MSSSPSPSLGVTSDTLTQLTTHASKLGASLDQAFAKAALQGKHFDATLKSVEKSLVSILARAAGQQLGRNLASLFTGTNGADGASQEAPLIPFASGGIVTTPTILGGRALTGEAGPEAIMPLQRGPDGSLGLRGGSAPTINITIQAQDVESFRRSEAQLAATMTRALQRGRRAM